ncbi:TRAP transporter large permease [Denitrobaculum tricleocarpae]|uniref:TRAP transporter large permease protein n=1 Tax=Denitrobaculum tricleocarpae TaxID=2591009 RepID=A0A545TKF4_9PROT|nr:TRAP transporter large permease subunit [Denitrobaculum tricleocarpae]TQV77687.1 TRAP transporter large permease subunit [Denitrobaculum tricleocarpae]
MAENEWLAIGMIVSFFLLTTIGVPVAIGIALSGFIFGFLGFGESLFNLLPHRIYGVVSNYTLMAIPLFVFMGVMLEKSKIAEELIEVVGYLAGGLKGGMALAIVVVGVVLGASTGIVGATVVTLGLLTLPVLVRRGYDKSLATGCICAAGTLGQIIPPSLVLILLADITGQSVGTLFAAAMVPGLALAALYCLYILGFAYARPASAPPIPLEERSSVTGAALAKKAVLVIGPPLALVATVLGTIIGGVAAPTEAASMGAFGSLLVALLNRRLTWPLLVAVLRGTTRITAMIFFILVAAQIFALAFRGLQGESLVHAMFEALPGGVNAGLLFMMLLLFILGFFLEWIEISYIALPLFFPYFAAANVDPVWLAILVAINLQTSFLTPPFGWALFFLKGVAPPDVTTLDIYKGVIPFILIQVVMLAILFAVPELSLWLPEVIGW